MPSEKQQNPNARIVYKPLKADTKKVGMQNPYLRAENEDDDGYDPYSDLREETPLFEKNPWD